MDIKTDSKGVLRGETANLPDARRWVLSEGFKFSLEKGYVKDGWLATITYSNGLWHVAAWETIDENPTQESVNSP